MNEIKQTVVHYGFKDVSVGSSISTTEYPYPSFHIMPLTEQEIATDTLREGYLNGDVSIIFADNQAIRDLILGLNDLLVANGN